MEPDDIISQVESLLEFSREIPVLAWIVVIVIVIYLFGDRKRWSREIEFSGVKGFGSGEVDIEAFGNKVLRREKCKIEIELELEPEAQNRDYELFLNSRPIYSIPQGATRSARIRINDKYRGPTPRKGDLLEIKQRGETVVSGKINMNDDASPGR